MTGSPSIDRFFRRAQPCCGTIRPGIRAIMRSFSHLPFWRSEPARPRAGSSPLAEAVPPPAGDVMGALSSCRGAFLSVGLFSGVSNILMLTGAALADAYSSYVDHLMAKYGGV